VSVGGKVWETSVKALHFVEVYKYTNVAVPLTFAILDQFGWDVISHHPYGPDLAPFNCHSFSNLNEHFGGKTTETDEEMKKEDTQYPRKEVAASFYEAGVQKLPVRLEKASN